MRREYTLPCFVLSGVSSSAESLHSDSYEFPFYAGAAVCVILVFLLLFLYTHLRRTGKLLSDLSHDHAELKLKHAEASQANEQLNELLEQEKENHTLLEQSYHQLESTLESARHEQEALQAGCDNLHTTAQAYQDLQAEHATLQAAYDHQQEELAQCRHKLEKSEEKTKQLLALVNELRTETAHRPQQPAPQTPDQKDHPNQRPLTLTDDKPQGHAGNEKPLTPLPGEDAQWDSKEEFLSQIIQFMRDNMDNSDLNIEFFAQQMNISRSMLCRKIKTVTGLTPVEFMHRVRITYAVELLKSDYTFSQIAYMTGFNDPKYFTKCFKRYTGLTPSEYKEKRLQKHNKGNKELFSHNSSYQFANYLGEDLYS